AALQVLLADIAPMNPVLIKSTIRIAVDARPGASREDDSIDIDDSGPEVLVNVALSNSLPDPEAHNRAILAMCYQLLHAVHVRTPDELQDLLEPLFRGGLIHKVSIGRLYVAPDVLLDVDHYTRCAYAIRQTTSDA